MSSKKEQIQQWWLPICWICRSNQNELNLQHFCKALGIGRRHSLHNISGGWKLWIDGWQKWISYNCLIYDGTGKGRYGSVIYVKGHRWPQTHHHFDFLILMEVPDISSDSCFHYHTASPLTNKTCIIRCAIHVKGSLDHCFCFTWYHRLLHNHGQVNWCTYHMPMWNPTYGLEGLYMEVILAT